MTKTYLLIFTGILLFISCTSSVKKHNKTTGTNANLTKIVSKGNVSPNYNNPILKEYNSFLLKQDTSSMESSVVSANKFVSLFNKQDKNTCDTAFMLFSDYYRKLTNHIDELHFKDTTIKYDSLLTDSGKPLHQISGKLLLYAKKLKNNGFKVYMSEGDTYIGQDLDFVAKWFYEYISPPMKEYLIQLNKDDKEGFSEDAELTINPQQFIERTVWWEKFAFKYPNMIISGEAKSIWKSYLGALLEGMDNSPVILDDQKTIDNYYKTAYSYLQDTFPSSQTNKIVSPYFKLLLQKDNAKANDLLKIYRRQGIID